MIQGSDVFFILVGEIKKGKNVKLAFGPCVYTFQKTSNGISIEAHNLRTGMALNFIYSQEKAVRMIKELISNKATYEEQKL